jgi:hypothetical protein
VKTLCTVVLLCGLCLVGSGTLSAQVCCAAPPTAETTTATGTTNTYETLFQMTLTGGSGNYVGWGITEYSAAPGSDGCYNAGVNTALVPEYPVISGGSWTVAAGNSWGPDAVGWLPASVSYIRANSPLNSKTPLIVTFPCGAIVYQALTILCPGGSTPDLYDPSVRQTETVYSTYVINSREGTSNTINH